LGLHDSSARAIANLSAICKNHLPDNHQIEIVDLLQDPRRVLSDHIVATPTLIKLSPAPVRKIIGDLGEEAKVLLALGLQQRVRLTNTRSAAVVLSTTFGA
jgi:circadian clock protein KaiB